MCTRYIAPDAAAIERAWHIGSRHPFSFLPSEVFPQRQGPFIRAAKDGAEPHLQALVGQWGLIPWFAKAAKLSFATSNARSEELKDKASYKHPWARGQRCIIPAVSFDEPCWETGKHIRWTFRRADGALWALAGIWNTWVDKATSEIHESYTMLTQNADHHPLMNRMHRPDPKRSPEMQDKRSVVPIEFEDVGTWLHGTLEQATALIRLAPVERFSAAPSVG